MSRMTVVLLVAGIAYSITATQRAGAVLSARMVLAKCKTMQTTTSRKNSRYIQYTVLLSGTRSLCGGIAEP